MIESEEGLVCVEKVFLHLTLTKNTLRFKIYCKYKQH